MKTNPAIQVERVSKCYKQANSNLKKVINAFAPKFNRGVNDFWALKDITFQVERGESVALIGRNGSGKSTLLEIITGTRNATSGEVFTRGRVAALLQLGSGFNPEFTGTENVYLNGMLLGLSRHEVEQKIDEIISFADIGPVLDQPVKHYSSGMLVRLAFSVQVALEPDILIIDEALAVGDFFFQQRCATRMQEIREKGTTILFVSHSLDAVKKICDRALVLKEGTISYDGNSEYAIQMYLRENQPKTKPKNDTSSCSSSPQPVIEAWQEIIAERIDTLSWQTARPDNILVEGGLLGVCTHSESGLLPLSILAGDTLCARVYFSPPPNITTLIQLLIKDRYDRVLYSTTSLALGIPGFIRKTTTLSSLDFRFSALLKQGQYSLVFIMNEVTDNSPSRIGSRVCNTATVGPLSIYFQNDLIPPFRSDTGLPIEASTNLVNNSVYHEQCPRNY